MNLRNYSGTLRKSGTLSKYIFIISIIFSGCAIIRHTPKSYSVKELNSILSDHQFIQDSVIIKYRIYGKGLAFSGKARLRKKDSMLLISTHNFFTGEKTLRISIGNSGFALLDFATLYLFGKNPLKSFTFAGTDPENLLFFVRKLDTVKVAIKNNRVILIKNRHDNILLFYDKKGELFTARGSFQGFSFEGVLLK